MALTFIKGDMFSEPAEAIVNTVNCAGVMGKGVALEFKKRWPKNYRAYKKQCDAKQLSPGTLFVYDNGDLLNQSYPRYLINFPTKLHWRSKSKIQYIEDGLDVLIDTLAEYRIKSVAMPRLGCGNGGLNWSEIRSLIERKLANINDVDIKVFESKEVYCEEPEHESPSSLKMTFERAVTMKALSDLETHFDGSYDRISIHKIVYFLQALGVNYQLGFARNKNGPYSETLKGAFKKFEEHHLISGFSGEDKVSSVTPRGCAMADEFLKSSDHAKAEEIVRKLNRLIQGFESAYGLELLSTVHWLVTFENKKSVQEIIDALNSWSEAKRTKFTPDNIHAAYDRLEIDNLLA